MSVCRKCSMRLFIWSAKTIRASQRSLQTIRFLTTAKSAPGSAATTRENGEKEAHNPLLDANKFVTDPIFKEEDLIFRPTQSEVGDAAKLFSINSNQGKHKVAFVKGAYYPEEAPDYNLPEIAMLGRSNVGKSSLIKALFSDVPGLRVRTSRTPGFTKLLLFYQAGKAFSLVDLPGYGDRQPENFAVTAEGYLRTRKNLQMAFLLIDIADGFRPMDLTAIKMLEDFSRPYLVVITKADKASTRTLVTSLFKFRDVIQTQTTTCLPQPFLVSAKKRKGIAFLQSFIAHVTSNVKVQNR